MLTVASALALAAAHSYSIKLVNDTWVGNTELKPGDYKVEMSGDKAVLRSGKNVFEVPAKMETDQQKHDGTSLILSHANSKAVLKEIRLGGSKDMIVFP
jgi:hypothetical protein